MPASPSPASPEAFLHELVAAADARISAAPASQLRRVGRLLLSTRTTSAAAESLLTRAFGTTTDRSAQDGSSPGDATTEPITLDVIDDAGGALPQQPELWSRVPAAATSPAPGAKALWQHGGARVLASRDTGALMLFTPSTRRAIAWYRDVAALPGYEHAAPMRDLLHWLHAGSGTFMVHGAAVASETGGVLIVGPGGRGKSTLATTALLLGSRFAGDDYVAVDPVTTHAYGLYLSVKVHAHDAPRYAHAFSDSQAALDASGDKQALFFARPPAGFREGIGLRALAVPNLTLARVGWQAISKAHALAALAPSTLFQTSGDRDALFAACSALVRALPTFAWNPGPLDAGFPERVRVGLRTIAEQGVAA